MPFELLHAAVSCQVTCHFALPSRVDGRCFRFHRLPRRRRLERWLPRCRARLARAELSRLPLESSSESSTLKYCSGSRARSGAEWRRKLPWWHSRSETATGSLAYLQNQLIAQGLLSCPLDTSRWNEDDARRLERCIATLLTKQAVRCPGSAV